MRYEDAVKVWGASRLTEDNSRGWSWNSCKKLDIAVASVTVEFDFDEGYACCGGRDPDCYCSFAESPSADVVIRGWCACGRMHETKIDVGDFNFVVVLGEIVAAGGGSVTAEVTEGES